MNNEQFTSGPWLAIGPKIQPDLEQTYFSIQSQSGKITKDTYECPGFYYPHSVQSEDTMQANANLIAAAPDMYEALKKVRDILRQSNLKEGAELIQTINNALSKANHQSVNNTI